MGDVGVAVGEVRLRQLEGLLGVLQEAEAGAQQPRDLSGAFFTAITGDDLRAASIDALETMRDRMDDAYGDGADDRRVMNVFEGSGSLADIKAFVTDAVSGPADDARPGGR